MANRVLFHGTTTKFRRQIERAGALLPRARTGKSVYSGKLESNPERVYLTDVYAVQFGLMAVEKHGGNLLVCRTIVDESELLPDDDFQASGLHRLKFDDHQWPECLSATGCVSVRGPVRVDRIYVVKGKLLKEFKETEITINTGLMHTALKKRIEDALNYALWSADRFDISPQE